MLHLLCLVTQIHGNECVTNINYGTEVRTTEGSVVDEDPQNILELPIRQLLKYYFHLLYFHYLRLSTWFNTDETSGCVN